MMTKETILKILGLLHYTVICEGGDGDAIWYTRYSNLDDIEEGIKAFHKETKTYGWRVEREEHRLRWGMDQEWVIVTTDEDYFKSSPSWVTLQIRC